MSTAVTLLGTGIDDHDADLFFDRIRELEDVLSRFREHSDLSRLARGELGIDDVDPAVRIVLDECAVLRTLTAGDFDYEPRHRSGNPADPILDVNALAKGWIIEEASTTLRMTATEFLLNAGGDVVASARRGGARWRVGVQHPTEPSAVLGTFEVASGAVATSGTYERGDHIRAVGPYALQSVTVVGPSLAQADGLSTAVFSSGESPPPWWRHVDPAYGLLTVARDHRLRWLPPTNGTDFEWS
jgi:thiamine biosynthesis lipoprotein